MEHARQIRGLPACVKRAKYFNLYLEPLARLLGFVAALLLPASILSGFALILCFLDYVSGLWGLVPISNSDVYSSSILPMVCLSAGIFLLFLTFPVLFLVQVRLWFEGSLSKKFPAIKVDTIKKDGQGKAARPSMSDFWGHLYGALRDYIILHMPILSCGTMIFLAGGKFQMDFISFILGIYGVHFYLISNSNEDELSGTGLVLLYNLAWTFIFFPSSYLIAAIYNFIYEEANTYASSGVLFSVLFFVFSDCLLFSRRIGFPEMLGGFLLLVLALIVIDGPGFSMMGAMSLRLLGVGGGIPASLVVKNYKPNTSSPLNVVRGCIIINLGGQIVVEELRTAPSGNSDCTPQHWVRASKRSDLTKKFCKISVYQRSDVVLVSGIDAPFEQEISNSNDSPNCYLPTGPAKF